MASLTLQTWLTHSTISARVVLDRLSELANYGLDTALKTWPPGFGDVLLNSDGLWAAHKKDASSFGYSRSYWDTTVWLTQRDGKTTLTGNCSRGGSSACTHMFDLQPPAAKINAQAISALCALSRIKTVGIQTC